MGTSRRHEISGSETMVFITHSTERNISVSTLAWALFARVSTGQHDKPTWMLHEQQVCITAEHLSLGNPWFFWQISKHVCSLSKAGQSHYLISQPWETNLKNSIAVRDLQSGTSSKIYKSATDPKSTLSPYTNVIQITSIHLLSFLFNLFLWHFHQHFCLSLPQE